MATTRKTTRKSTGESAAKKQTLVIVESPSKATTIKGYLGSNYKVIASVGHIRDLPKSTFAVDIEHGFAPHYINIRGKGDIIRMMKKEAKAASRVFLATDPDREGEAISWHIAGQLGIPETDTCRVTFNEVTKDAIRAAIKSPRTINMDLVNAQQARRILDRIVGYKLSPLLWEKVKSGLSAGRVQSVATRILAEREEEIRAFIPAEYWTLDATLQNAAGESVSARFFGKGDKKIRPTCKEEAEEIRQAVSQGNFTAKNIRHAQRQKQPSPPFTTSTMQQEAYHKLGFRSQRIMKVAQELYEGVNLGSENGGVQGLITYMRTDSLRISQSAQEAALSLIGQMYGEAYLPKTPRVFKTKAGAQDAHEAIRPANVTLLPSAIKKHLSSDQYRLYKLIWERFVASQMAPAVYNTVSMDFENNGYIYKTNGYNLVFRGYTAVYDNGPVEDGEDEQSFARLPVIAEGETLKARDLSADQHYTEPPMRYTEASLIKFLEENGIGRPSTYTTIITTIIDRGYVKREGKSLMPTPLGEVTNKLMLQCFPDIVNYEFTASMETKLDEIEEGKLDMTSVLADFYKDFSVDLEKAASTVSRADIAIPAEVSEYPCEKCGSMMVYKNGRFGRFLACPNYPECRNTMAIDKDGKPVKQEEKEPQKADFKCELCGGDVVIRNGRYGQFYACVNYPTCKFTKQKVNKIGVACPECGADIVAKKGKGRVLFYSCERYPECQFSSWDLPLAEKCPECGGMLMYRKSRKLVFCRNKSCGYKRAEDRETAGQNAESKEKTDAE